MSRPARKKTAFIPTIAIGTTLASVVPVCVASCSSGCGGGANSGGDAAFTADVSTDFVWTDYVFNADVSTCCRDVYLPKPEAGDALAADAGDATADAADATEEAADGATAIGDAGAEGD